MNYNLQLKDMEKITNHEGAVAYKLTPELELYTAVVTASLNDKFYERRSELMDRICELIGQVDPEFVARLAVYTRKEMHLRSIPLLLLVELARVHNGDDLVARAVEQTVLRADEIMELLMCYQLRNPSKGMKKLGKLSQQIQNGLQRAFNRFDEYQFAKYNRKDLVVKLRDALFLVHPKAKDESQQALFDKIANNSLSTPYTWETELSALGQQGFESDELKRTAFRQKWEELINSGKLGYMALMRNLRNMLECDISLIETQKVANRLSDPIQVANSKQLPFRYLSAYRELEVVGSTHVPMIMDALESAVKSSATNIEGFDEHTRILIASDVSGSMYNPISPRSKVFLKDIGIMLSTFLRHRCKEVISGIFGDEWRVVNMSSDNILLGATKIDKLANSVGFSTNGYKVIDWLIEKNMVMDKVMMFTDMQMWNSHYGNSSFEKSWREYKHIAPDAKLYLFDLAGYGQSPLRVISPDVYLIGGWSDRIFDVLKAIEHDEEAVNVISNYTF